MVAKFSSSGPEEPAELGLEGLAIVVLAADLIEMDQSFPVGRVAPERLGGAMGQR